MRGYAVELLELEVSLLFLHFAALQEQYNSVSRSASHVSVYGQFSLNRTGS